MTTRFFYLDMVLWEQALIDPSIPDTWYWRYISDRPPFDFKDKTDR